MSTQKNKKRRGFGIFCLVLGAALVISAAALLVYNQTEDSAGGASSAAALETLKAGIEERKLSGSSQDSNAYPIQYDSEDGSMNTIEIDGYLYIGYITLPTLGIELPVMAEWDYTRLKIAPCRYYGSYKTDDLVIAGHSYKTHFKYIENMTQGDPVIFTDADGNTHSYTADSLEMLLPSDTDEMTDSGYALTLFTCTYTAAHRATLRCVKA